jgi:hypothetical protein
MALLKQKPNALLLRTPKLRVPLNLLSHGFRRGRNHNLAIARQCCGSLKKRWTVVP